jgi:hypothetical protein
MEVAYCEFFAPRREIISFDVATRQTYSLDIPGLSACVPRYVHAPGFRSNIPGRRVEHGRNLQSKSGIHCALFR